MKFNIQDIRVDVKVPLDFSLSVQRDQGFSTLETVFPVEQFA